MFCVNCGAKLTEGTAFCGNCGYKTNTSPVVAQASHEVVSSVSTSAPVEPIPTPSPVSTPISSPTFVTPPEPTVEIPQQFQVAQPATPAVPTPAQTTPVTVQLVIASRRRRFVAAWVDYILIQIVAGLVSAILTSSETAGGVINFLVLTIGSVLYYYLMELEYGKTVGKMLLGMRTVRDDGAPLDSGTVLTRTLIRLIPFESLAILGTTKRTLHDRWSKTRVVRV